MSFRSKYLPALSAQERAHWAYQLATHGLDFQVPKFTVTDADIEHAGSTRAEVEALIDELAAGGNFPVLRSSYCAQSSVRINMEPTSASVEAGAGTAPAFPSHQAFLRESLQRSSAWYLASSFCPRLLGHCWALLVLRIINDRYAAQSGCSEAI